MKDNRRDSREAHAGVDAFLGERGSHARLVAVPGDEDQVPDLEKAIAVLAVRPAVRPPAAVLLAPVVVDLGVRPAGSGRTRGPEVVLVAKAPDALLWDSCLLPDFKTLVVIVVDPCPEPLLVEAELLCQELVRIGNRLLLEVIAEGEVAQHLEEGQMVTVVADDVDVDGTEDFLAGGGPREGRLGLPEEIRLKGHHPRACEQQSRIAERDQRGAR